MWLEYKLYWLEKDINFWCHLEFWSYLTAACLLFLVWILSPHWNFSNRVPTLVSQRRINFRNIGCALSYLLLMNRWCTELELVVLLFQHRTFSVVVTFRFTDHIMTTEVVNLCQGAGQLERLCCTSRRQHGWSSGYCCLQIDWSFRTASFWGVNLWTESRTPEPGNATYLQHSL